MSIKCSDTTIRIWKHVTVKLHKSLSSSPSENALARSGKGTARRHHFMYPFQRWQHRWPLPWVRVHQTIIIRYDEIIPFMVNIILCQHYYSIVAVKERCRESHDGVVQCSVFVSESLLLLHKPANMLCHRPLLASIPRRLFCFDISFNLSSKNNVHTFTKARLHADCQNNTTLYQGFPATDDRVNCICFLVQDTML